jgi:universal stress protein A
MLFLNNRLFQDGWQRKPMTQFNNVLVAIDLSNESSQVLEKALALAKGAQINVVYVYEPISQLYGGELAFDFSEVQKQIQQQAVAQLADLAKKADIPVECQHVLLGKPAAEIRRLATELEADLIVVGTHSRHGLGLLLGSTANSVLHGVGCDVFVVRIST